MNLGAPELLIILLLLAIPALVIVFVLVVRSVRRQPTSDASVPTAATARSVADEVAKLVALRDAGALTEEEFAAQKAKPLA